MKHNQIQELQDLIERAEKLKEESKEKTRPELDLSTKLSKLRSNLENYKKKTTSIEVGDILVWKEGLKNRKFPKYDEPCIVIEVLEEPIVNDISGINSAYYKEPNDIKLGIIAPEDDFVTFYFDSRRFRKLENI